MIVREFFFYFNNDVFFLYFFKVIFSVSGNIGNRYYGECRGGIDSRIFYRGKGIFWVFNGGIFILRGGDSNGVFFV